MKSCPTYYANIYVGVRPSYDRSVSKKELKKNLEYAERICQCYCDEVGLGLTFTKTTFLYTDGNEPGVIIGLINYPRFPSDPIQIELKAKTLARVLLKELNQERLSIMFPTKTLMLEKEDI